MRRLFRCKPEEPLSPFPEVQELAGLKYQVEAELSRGELYQATDRTGARHRIRILRYIAPALADVLDLLGHLYLVSDHFSWDHNAKFRLMQLAQQPGGRLQRSI